MVLALSVVRKWPCFGPSSAPPALKSPSQTGSHRVKGPETHTHGRAIKLPHASPSYRPRLPRITRAFFWWHVFFRSYDFAKKVSGLRALFTPSSALFKGATGGEKGGEEAEDGWPEMHWLLADRYAFGGMHGGEAPSDNLAAALGGDGEEDSVAFLQFTSGSTSAPKGVMITHGNLRHNLDLIVTGLVADADTVGLGFLSFIRLFVHLFVHSFLPPSFIISSFFFLI